VARAEGKQNGENKENTAPMTNHKQKSSGWRPADKRRAWAETKERALDAQHARFKGDSDRQELWRSCPAARCRRNRACAIDPYRCTKERGRNAPAGKTVATPQTLTPAAKEASKEAAKEAPRFAISAKDAAAIIKADVEAHIAAHGNDPDGLLRGGF
jgi:hypothetical protein